MITKTVRDFLRKAGSKGGKARDLKLTSARKRAIAKKAVAAREAKRAHRVREA